MAKKAKTDARGTVIPFGGPVNTVGELIDLLKKFPRGMSVRVSVPEDFDRFSPHSAYIGNNLHEYGLIADDLWTDGTGHAVLQIPLCPNEDHDNFTFDGKMKYEVKPSKDDPEGTGTYFS